MTLQLVNPPSDANPASRLQLASSATLAETGLSEDLIVQLVVKLLHFNADCTGVEVANRLGLEFSVVEPVLEQLKRSLVCEVVGGGLLGAPSFRYRLTDTGRRRALLFLEHNQYVGAAPVPLAQYRAYMTEFRQATQQKVSPAAVHEAVSHLVVSDRVVNQIGPAVTSGQSIFVYGSPGNGKTVIAQAIHNLLRQTIAIPHALEVEGHIIKLYNPIVHNTLGTIFQALGRRALARGEYERALQLDGAASYALNNLCYGWVLEGRAAKAIATCEAALRVDPTLTAARNNLGLAHAVAGDAAAASAAFAQAGDRATERYNTGIIRLAERDYAGAIAAFESAHTARPSLAEAAARAQQARAAKAALEE